ncbi:MAG: phosphoribosylaminoimidazolesuccinocarboxamide synthase [Crenarchaeota archaeon]|nr:phosphoribosylaminoimidazolesuccinocarboxamide synthase [Thermoproteota archaeon]MDW8033956.1 phosphoribosylaminoimidazolesuccinocarboxamide synthase [Nitrososphaerota archaeon]
MGSVKDLEIIKKPTSDHMGIGRFHFSDRYSVFDWGEMPDHIEEKGAALCLMGAYCFEELERRGIKTHYRGLVNDNGKVVYFKELESPTNIMEINLVNVYRPNTYLEGGKLKYDYSIYTPELKNFLIPLEIIYRNGLPEGSSVFKRLEQGLITLEDLELDHMPKPGEKLDKPIFDVSTKLEEGDRYVTWKEAQKIAGLTDAEVEAIKKTLSKVNETITEIAQKSDLVNEDGKIELAFDPERRLMVVDVVGTLDECRFTYQGIHVSKEIARIYYRRTEWYKDVEEAKRVAVEKGIKDWKSLCKTNPPKLDPELKTIISEMYMAAANALTSRKMFDVPSLAEVVVKYRDYINSSL